MKQWDRRILFKIHLLLQSYNSNTDISTIESNIVCRIHFEQNIIIADHFKLNLFGYLFFIMLYQLMRPCTIKWKSKMTVENEFEVCKKKWFSISLFSQLFSVHSLVSWFMTEILCLKYMCNKQPLASSIPNCLKHEVLLPSTKSMKIRRNGTEWDTPT